MTQCSSILALFLVVAVCAQASNVQPIPAGLEYDETWLRLLKYVEGPDGLASSVNSARFFVSPDGKANPRKELEAFYRAVFADVDNEDDAHVQCLFPARYLWLKEQIDLSAAPRASCESYREWLGGKQPGSISLLYVSGFLGNPASYYGHLLLKVNAPGSLERSELLDNSVNYGAIYPDNTDPVSYIIKGILGGYDGGYSNTRFYFHAHHYGELELRDIWEYELQLDQRDLELVVAHAWEMLRNTHVYYFFRHNCAYRIAEILEVVPGIRLIPDNFVFTIPQSIIQNLFESNLDGRPLVKSVEFHPSRQSQLYEKVAELSDPSRRALVTLATASERKFQAALEGLSLAEKHDVLDALIDYDQFGTERNLAGSTRDPQYIETVLERFSLPPGPGTNDHEPGPPRGVPHAGRSPSLVRYSAAYNDSLGWGRKFTLRPAYYDPLDGYLRGQRGSRLTMAEIELADFAGETDLLRFEVFAVNSINASRIRLPKDRTYSWQIAIGADRERLDRNEDLVARFRGDIGYSMFIGGDVIAGIFLGGVVNHRRVKNSYFDAIVSADVVGHKGAFSWGVSFDSSLRPRAGYTNRQESIELRYELRKDLELRLAIRRDDFATETSIGLGAYW